MRDNRLLPVCALIVLISAFLVVGCDDSRSLGSAPPDVDINGAWDFAVENAVIDSCTTDDLTAQFEGAVPCDFSVTITEADGDFSSDMDVGCVYGFGASTLANSGVSGTTALIEGMLEGEEAGPVTNVLIEYSGGTTDDEATLSPLTLWDADEESGDIPRVCADAQDISCFNDDDSSEDPDPSACVTENACQAATFAGGGGGPPIFGTCLTTADPCSLTCSNDEFRGCIDAEFDCEPAEEDEDDPTCVDTCSDLGDCIDAVCSFSGQFVGSRP
ncbi:MAG: hypothetical protein GY716_01760 [bacterium]|nr:hypothetical protein [bacterium]